MNIQHTPTTPGNMALVCHGQPSNQNEPSTFEEKYKSFAHILSISDNNFLDNINKIDMLNNYIPWVPTDAPSISMLQYNQWVSDTMENCARYNLSCHSYKYQKNKRSVMIELITFIKSLPDEVQKDYHFSNIQPHHIALFLERSFIPNHAREDPNVDLNNTKITIVDKYIISESAVRTAVGAISSFLSANYGRDNEWNIHNIHGNPCKSRRIKDLRSSIRKANEKRGLKIVHATPITANVLIKMIDAFDTYNNNLKETYESKDPKARTLADILEILLIERDICYYIYMFISLQRGGDATKLTAENVVFGSSEQTEEIDYVDFTIYPHQVKNQTFENKPKIMFTINRNHNWHLKDGIYKKGMPDKYCFIHRYLNFQKLCSIHGYEKRDMVSIFPSSKNKKLDFSKNQDYQSASKKFQANMKKIKGLISLDIIKLNLTLHSFRRGGIQLRHLNGDSQDAVMKQAGHASKGMNTLYRDNKHIRSEKTIKKSNKSIKGKELEDTDDNIEDEDAEQVFDGSDEYNEAMEDKDDSDEDDLSCVICEKCDNEAEMLICECCERGYHFKCVGLEEMPKEDEWYCNDCHAEPKSEIVKGFENHVGRLIKYKTKTNKKKWQHACVEFYDYQTKKHTLALGQFTTYEEAIEKIDDLKKVKKFDMKESFELNRLRFTDKNRWNTKGSKKKGNRSEKRKQSQIEYNEEEEDEDEEDSDHFE